MSPGQRNPKAKFQEGGALGRLASLAKRRIVPPGGVKGDGMRRLPSASVASHRNFFLNRMKGPIGHIGLMEAHPRPDCAGIRDSRGRYWPLRVPPCTAFSRLATRKFFSRAERGVRPPSLKATRTGNFDHKFTPMSTSPEKCAEWRPKGEQGVSSTFAIGYGGHGKASYGSPLLGFARLFIGGIFFGPRKPRTIQKAA